MNNVVSFIIPVYNTEISLLSACLYSISKQTYECFEVLIVDSSDNGKTNSFLEQYIVLNEKFKLFKSLKCASLQRNIGIEKSNGEFIAFIDSDDYISENYLEVLLNALIANDASVAYPQLIKDVLDDRKSVGLFPQVIDINGPEINEYNYFVKSSSSRLVNPVKLYKRSLIGDTRFDESLIHGEDMMFNYELSKKGFKAVYCPDAKYYFTGEIKANSARKRLSVQSAKIIDVMHELYKEKRKIYSKENLDGIYSQFSNLFYPYYYEATRSKRKDVLKVLKKHKLFYAKKHHSINEIMFLFFPCFRRLLKKCLRKDIEE